MDNLKLNYKNNTFAVVPNINHIHALTHSELRLYLQICKYLEHKKQTCFPSQKTLTEDMGFSGGASVYKVLKRLEKKGFITQTPRYRSDGSQTSNLIQVNLLDTQEDGSSKDVSDPRVDTPFPSKGSLGGFLRVEGASTNHRINYITNFSDEKSVASFSENKGDQEVTGNLGSEPKAGTSSDMRARRQFTVEATDSEGTPVAKSAGRPKSKKSKLTQNVIDLVKKYQPFLDIKSLNDHTSADEIFNLACQQITYVRLKQVNPSVTPDDPVFKAKLADMKNLKDNRIRAGMLIDYIARYAFQALPNLGEDYYSKKVTTLKHFKNSFPQLCAKALVAVEEGVLDSFHYGTFTSSN